MATICVIALAGSFFLSLICTAILRSIAIKHSFVDQPQGRKAHAKPIALGGGIALIVSMCVPILVVVSGAVTAVRFGVPSWCPDFIRVHLGGIALKAPQAAAVLGGAVVLHLVGLIDDKRPLGPVTKLVAQIVVAAIVAGAFGIRMLELESLPVGISVVLTTLWIVIITNAFNFLDNMDGLSAGVAIIAGTIFAVTAIGSGQIFVPVMMLALVGALMGFLVFNFPPASIFMGDAGSLPLGFLMAVLIVLTTFYDADQGLSPTGLLLPPIVLAVPLYDVGSVFVHRLRAGERIWQGDRRHFSHRLMKRGLSARSAVLTIYLATAATSISAILLPRVDWTGAALIFAQTVCVVVMVAILESVDTKETRDA